MNDSTIFNKSINKEDSPAQVQGKPGLLLKGQPTSVGLGSIKDTEKDK